MFDRDGFIAYVGAKSGTTYAAGVDNIEKLYGKDVDAEYEKDHCASLLSFLKDLRNADGMSTSDLNGLSTRTSNLRRYVEYRDGGKPSAMKIIDQLRDCLSDVGLGTRMKRQEIVSLVVDRFGTNPNSIVPSDYCYNMTNKGIASDHVSFFLNVGTGVYEYVGEDYSTPTIQQIIAEYKADFERVDDEERYKWEALGHYKQHWNIEADNFAEMCREAYRWAGEQYKRPRDGKTDGGNLLTSQMYYPYKMIVEFAENDPEFVRHLFKSLFDEEAPLERRYLDFRAGCEKCLEEKRKREPDRGDKGLDHYQDLHAISVYLAFEFPEKYFIYKYSVYTKFRDLIAFQDGKGTSEVWKLENYNRMCNYVLAAVRSDDELTELSRRRLDENCYKDPEYHLLTMDVVYFGSRIDKGRVYKMNGSSKGHPGQGTDIGKNTILYGPPGTGKTYHTVLYAVSIIENKPLAEIKSEPYETVLDRFNQYKADKLIEFTTFHQSYGYEEFIEGIKPNTETDGEESGDIEYSIEAGLFKEFCERASQPIAKKAMDDVGLNSTPTVWKVSLYGTGDNPDRAECLQNGHIRIGWDGYGQTLADDLAYKDGGKAILNAFMNKMKIGDIVLSCYSSTTIDAIGIVAGDYEWHDEYAEMKRLRKVKWLAKDIREDIVELNNGRALVQPTVYQLNISAADAMNLAMKYMPKTKQLQSPRDNFVFIIDEINRGNISKIFGELITLIEPSKRVGQSEGMMAKLPYSKKPFGVPDNVYLLGTMNTADRSIATIDTALRRRFQFKEMQPDPNVLDGIYVEDISIQEMLSRMNQKISVLYDREHTIGHGYFMPLASHPTIEALAQIFENSIVPLLQEYFYDDYEKIRLVLGDNNKDDAENQFIIAQSVDMEALFGSTNIELDESVSYEINPSAFFNIDAYRSI